MAVCKKGFTLETKTCIINCKTCAEYQNGNKKQRMQQEFVKRKKIEQEYIKTANPETCQECKLYVPEDSEWDGTYAARCNALNTNFPLLKGKDKHKKKDKCPFVKAVII